MKKQLGFIGSLVLAATFVLVGVSGNLALADQNNQGQNNNDQGQNIQRIPTPVPVRNVPEPSSFLLLGAAGLAGLGIWAWRRKSTNS